MRDRIILTNEKNVIINLLGKEKKKKLLMLRNHVGIRSGM